MVSMRVEYLGLSQVAVPAVDYVKIIYVTTPRSRQSINASVLLRWMLSQYVVVIPNFS
jgi:hypothetical protein